MKVILLIFCFIFSSSCIAQQATTKYLVFDDMANFWQAYDKMVVNGDSAEQVQLIQSQYIDKASYNLRLMLPILHYSALKYRANINAYPKFWKGLRERSRILMGNYKEIVEALERLKKIYHHIELPDIDFMVGCFEFGGKPFLHDVMIGIEVALADGNFDISRYRDNIKEFDSYTIDAVIYFVIHETIHTRQPDFTAKDLLTSCIMEGSCDFITELVTGKPLKRPYIITGNNFEQKIWEAFKKQMKGTDHEDWLYNKGLVVKGEEDLGYFMGYSICKYYYEHSDNKKQAIRRIINLNYTRHSVVYKFFKDSQYENKFKENGQ